MSGGFAQLGWRVVASVHLCGAYGNSGPRALRMGALKRRRGLLPS